MSKMKGNAIRSFQKHFTYVTIFVNTLVESHQKLLRNSQSGIKLPNNVSRVKERREFLQSKKGE